MKKPTYTYERQYTRNGNPMQRYQIFENSDEFIGENYPAKIAIVFKLENAKLITDFLNSLANGLQSWNDTLKWYQQYDPQKLKEEYRI